MSQLPMKGRTIRAWAVCNEGFDLEDWIPCYFLEVYKEKSRADHETERSETKSLKVIEVEIRPLPSKRRGKRV